MSLLRITHKQKIALHWKSYYIPSLGGDYWRCVGGQLKIEQFILDKILRNVVTFCSTVHIIQSKLEALDFFLKTLQEKFFAFH